MEIGILAAGEDARPVIANLVRLYIYGLSEIMGWQGPENGLFGGVHRPANPLARMTRMPVSIRHHP